MTYNYSNGSFNNLFLSSLPTTSTSVTASQVWSNGGALCIGTGSVGSIGGGGGGGSGSASTTLSVNPQTGTTYTFQSSDTGGVVTTTSSSAVTITLPNSMVI